MDSKYTGILDACSAAMAEVGAGTVGRLARLGCTEITCYWKHWVCVFPQHGPGRKHERRIELEAWQLALARRYPEELIRGLIHSDGYHSSDLRELFQWACALIGVESRPNNRWNISVAKRRSVEILDSFVGPKA